MNVIWIFEFGLNSKKEMTFEFEILFWNNLPRLVWPIWPAGPTGLLAQPAHPAQVWVGPPTQPSPYTLSSLSSVDPSGDLDRRRRRLAIPASSGDLHRRHLGRYTRLCALFYLHQIVSPAASSPRRSVAGSRSGFHLSATTEPDSSPASLWRLRCFFE
jgi:hypothetical protein